MAKSLLGMPLIPTLLLVAFALGTIASGYLLVQRIAVRDAVAGYLETAGTVTVSEQRGYRTKRAVLVAKYVVEGKPYLVNASSGRPEGMSESEMLQTYPAGSTVPVFHDPSDPSRASFGGRPPIALQIGGMLFSLLMTIGLLVWIFKR